MTPEHFDLVVIGSGPAGEKGAAQVAYFGKKVALIEKEPELGGAAANTGTLPSKTLRESALYLSGFNQRQLFGLNVSRKRNVTVADFMAREHLVKDREHERIQRNLERHRVTQYRGAAAFVDPHTVAVRPARSPEFRVSGDVILIATGSYPYRPAAFPFYDPRVFDSDTILKLHDIPETMLVVGGGVIGCEYACMFAALGVHVTVVEKRASVVGFLDGDVSEALRRGMVAMGVQVLTEDSVESVHPGPELIDVRLDSGTFLHVETILVSSGRCGNTEEMGLRGVGIEVTKRGHVPVNEHYQTSVPHVYAAGDVIGNPALASTSMEQARLAMVHAFDLKFRKGFPKILPYGIYTIPECSMAGKTEEELIAEKVPYVAGKAGYASNARGQIIGDGEGFLKLLFEEKGEDLKLVGVHMIGEQATELIHVGLTALLMEADADVFIETCYNYPTLTELYKYAAYDALGRRAAKRREGAGAAKG